MQNFRGLLSMQNVRKYINSPKWKCVAAVIVFSDMAGCGVATVLQFYMILSGFYPDTTNYDSFYPYISVVDPIGGLILNGHVKTIHNSCADVLWSNESLDTKWRRSLLRYRARGTSTTIAVLLLSGDIALNPGPPKYKYPCGQGCGKPFKKIQKGILCESCEKWFHTKWIKIRGFIYLYEQKNLLITEMVLYINLKRIWILNDNNRF